MIASGKNFATRKRRAALLRRDLFVELCKGNREIIIASANGTFIDRAEEKAISQKHSPTAIVYTPEASAG